MVQKRNQLKPKLKFCQSCPFLYHFYLNDSHGAKGELHLECHCNEELLIGSFYINSFNYKQDKKTEIPNECPYYLEQIMAESNSKIERNFALNLHLKLY